MLRYYDKAGILKPSTTDKFTGYRLYSVEQISIINRITFLRDVGFNVSEMTFILDNWNDDHVVEQLKAKQQEIKLSILSEKDKLNKIQYTINNIDSNKKENNFSILLKSIPSYQVLSLRKIIPNYFEEKQLWEELTYFINDNKIKVINGFDFSLYHDQEYKEFDVDVEICVPIEKVGKDFNGFIYRHTEEVEIMACTMVYGAYENIKGAYLSFAEWISNHNLYSMTNEPNRQICHRGPWNEKNIEKYLTEIQIPITKNTY